MRNQPVRDTLVVVPARLASARLPGKLLMECDGEPLLWHTVRAASGWLHAAQVVVATGDDEIEEAMKKRGVRVVRTVRDHRNGTSRAAEAVELLKWEGPLVMNLQADEPAVTPQMLTAARRVATWRMNAVGTLVSPLSSHVEETVDRDVVKAILVTNNHVRWFTRQPVEYGFHHVGVYVYPTNLLRTLASLPVSPGAKAEDLEQLDWLTAGVEIRAAVVDQAPTSVNDVSSLMRFRSALAARKQLDDAAPNG